MTMERTTRDQQREARRAERDAARRAALAREVRQRRVRVAAVVAAAVAVLGVVAVLAFTGTGRSGATAAGGPYDAGKESFRLPGLLDDTPVALRDHAGTPVVVNFFASWCVYCNEELPGFVEVARATKGKVDFIGVDTSDPGDGAAMARRFDLAGAGFGLGRDIGADPASDLWRSFGSQGLPVTAFYDAGGKLVDFSGGMLTQDQLQQRIKDGFGVDVSAPDATRLGAPVIPLIPRGAFELLRTHEGDAGFVPLDLRPTDQYAAGHLDGARNIAYPGDGFASAAATLDPDASYFIYDATGLTAEKAADTLHAAGLKHVYVIEGGFSAWTRQGLPTTR
jgi:rhodanese-related sulfurtransferase/thiol-disulfide isomerase/thioredoxin